jgi:hypothetical protein
MKQFETNGHRCLVVKPERVKDPTDIGIYKGVLYGNITDKYSGVKLPPGEWEIVGTSTTDKITDGEAREIVKCHVKPGWNGYGNGLWENYEKGDPLFMSAKESLSSLLKSQGYENLSEIVLLKKIQ